LKVKKKDQKALVSSVAASSWGPENLLEFYKRFGPFPGNTAWIIQSTQDIVDAANLDGKVLPYCPIRPTGRCMTCRLAFSDS
jgi:hypothetical protein